MCCQQGNSNEYDKCEADNFPFNPNHLDASRVPISSLRRWTFGHPDVQT